MGPASSNLAFCGGTAAVATPSQKGLVMKWVILLITLTACGNEVNVAPEPSPTPNAETEQDDKEPVGETTEQKITAKSSPSEEEEAPAEVVAEEFTSWLDPMTDREWLIVGEGDAADAVCDTGYEVPDIFDLQEAEANGLADEFIDRELVTYIWTKNLSDGVVESWRDLTDTTSWMNTLTGGFVLCVEL